MKFLVALLLALAFCPASAKPEFWDMFRNHYGLTTDSEIGRAACVTCHVEVGKTARNSFGASLEKLVEESPEKTLTIFMLEQVENEDADGDGMTNLEEIRAGRLPGAVAKEESESPSSQSAAPVVPTHSFHPLFVHFPLGIFLFGAVLDLWGSYRKSREIRSAAAIALLVGAIASVFAVVSGISAMLRMGISIEGTMLWHLVLGLTACALMLVVGIWRKGTEANSAGYWALLILSAVATAVSGHLGSTMVWG